MRDDNAYFMEKYRKLFPLPLICRTGLLLIICFLMPGLVCGGQFSQRDVIMQYKFLSRNREKLNFHFQNFELSRAVYNSLSHPHLGVHVCS